MSEPERASRLGAASALAILMSIVLCSRANALPAFARKYQTSCQTCHVAFPKLNAFGEAFRLNGYRMPKETEEMVKEKPVSMGSQAYKKLWPRAVWPSDVPSTVPLAVNIKFADVNTSSLNDDGTTTSVKNDFEFPQEANLFGAGTLGDEFSFLAELTFGQEPDGSVTTEIEHARFDIDSPFGPQNAFHFRIGKFAPNVADGFQEMWISTDAAIDSVFAYNPVGHNGGIGPAEDLSPSPVAFPATVTGIEGYGTIRHRALWVAGMANGISPGEDRFDGNNAKDVYARLDYKIGGMGFDEYPEGKDVPENNWRDDSFRIGAFVYHGNGKGIDFASVDADLGDINIQDRTFTRTGFFASAYIRDLNLFGGYIHGSDTLRTQDPTDEVTLDETKPTYHSWFGQADYVFYPWLHGTFRYEELHPGDPSVQSLRTGVASVSALVRANIKGMLEYQRDLREGKNHSLDAVLRFAF